MRISLAFLFLLSSNAWALGLGEIQLDSALNAPLRAQIELLSATPEELENLTISLASAETFERYGLDRPFFLQSLEFRVVMSASGAYVDVTSTSPITEPFLTFLVEATWARGRLLREYTVLLDPPTFAPPPVAETRPAVTAPARSTPTDSARIERQAPPPQPTVREPEPERRPTPAPPPRQEPVETERAEPPPPPPPPAPAPSVADESYDATAGGDHIVQRRETLWGIALRVRPDSRLTMNQTMLAIYEANPDAFGGNINVLRAGANLRIPSADDIYRIDRGYALNEAQRQHAEWGGMPAPAPAPAPAVDPVETTTRPSLTLVPPDEEPVGIGTGEEGVEDGEPLTREQEILDRIAELEAAAVPEQRSLIEIRDNELAALRQELAEIRGEVYEPPAEEPLPEDEAIGVDEGIDEGITVDAEPGDEAAVEPVDEESVEEADTAVKPPPTIISSPAQPEPGIVDRILGILTNTWVLIIAGALLLAGAVLFWFLRRDRDGEDEPEAWTSATMAAPALGDDEFASTESLHAPAHDESIVVVEQESGIRPLDEDTVDAPAEIGATADSGSFGSLEDTFSSETAVNLDQSDPIAEADFHMAYGLYDQAADLINGALETEADNLDLLTKLCEIYFVWGNRDAFVDAARRVHQVAGDSTSGEWDKIVIMGQQIAADHELFAGAGVAGATRAVDLSFEGDMAETGALDMDFGEAGDVGGDIIDLGAGGDEVMDFGAGSTTEGAVDFDFGAEDAAAGDEDDDELDFAITRESPTLDASMTEDETAEMPAADSTGESPTIEDQFDGLGATSELPSVSDSVDEAIADSGQTAESTAEINLEELGLDLDELEATEVASLDDFDDLEPTEVAAEELIDATGSQEELGDMGLGDTSLNEALDDTSLNEALADTSLNEALEDTGINEALADPAAATGKNPEIDPDATGVQQRVDIEATGANEEFDIEAALSSTSEMRLAADETGQNPLMQVTEGDTEVGFDDTLLDATGHTQILPEDFAVDTAAGGEAAVTDQDETVLASVDDEEESAPLGDEDATMMAPSDDDDDFDFAKTEALPKDVFSGNMDLDETGELPAIASTDVDLDLDDLTAALKVSEMGDTVDMPRDDATVEHVRPSIDVEETGEIETMSLAPEDLSEDLHEARTMTEVGTKLDLARAYVDMGDPGGARSILEEVLDEGDQEQRQQAQQLLDSLPG
jgi:pilus assembly protein FimV